jgi:hypothetical protein
MKIQWTISKLVFIGIVCAIAWTYWYVFVPTHFRYRLTVEVSDAGQIRTASSILDIAYYCNSRNILRLSMGTGCGVYAQGVAPLIDLGAKGTLIAAIMSGGDGGPSGQSPEDLPLNGYHAEAPDIGKYRFAPAVILTENYYPPFIWIPPSNDWRQAKFTTSKKIASTIDASIKINSVSITPAYWAPLVNKVDPAPAWLLDLREDARSRHFHDRLPLTWYMDHWYVERFEIATDKD